VICKASYKYTYVFDHILILILTYTKHLYKLQSEMYIAPVTRLLATLRDLCDSLSSNEM